MKPLVSVVLPVYNESLEWLEQAVNSILFQSYKHLDIILLLDNPDNDVLKKYLLSISDNRIRVILNKKNLGLTETLNTALKLVQGEYIVRMDADDISDINRIEKQLSYIRSNDLDLIGCHYDTIDEKGLLINTTAKLVTDHVDIVKMLKFEQPIAHPTWFGKTEVFQVLKYHEVAGAEDYDFLCRAASSGFKLGNHPDQLLHYRVRISSITSQLRYIQLVGKFSIATSYRKIFNCNLAYVLENTQTINMEHFQKTFDTYEFGKQCFKTNVIKGLFLLMKSILFMPYSSYIRFKIKCRILANNLYKHQRSTL